ncbi:unnamed protein product [Moneuplotes crassus]|uniref:Uncharacterized protein n=1 Tax=Euplotes crassus TaxID=5936 RepID=A0AAD1Y1C1_EUPCR|nr:unnamed protein product [Moneuplotes crassus]
MGCGASKTKEKRAMKKMMGAMEANMEGLEKMKEELVKIQKEEMERREKMPKEEREKLEKEEKEAMGGMMKAFGGLPQEMQRYER